MSNKLLQTIQNIQMGGIAIGAKRLIRNWSVVSSNHITVVHLSNKL